MSLLVDTEPSFLPPLLRDDIRGEFRVAVAISAISLCFRYGLVFVNLGGSSLRGETTLSRDLKV